MARLNFSIEYDTDFNRAFVLKPSTAPTEAKQHSSAAKPEPDPLEIELDNVFAEPSRRSI